jgi:tetratricopeptide (TPR) repeat protein
MTRTKRGDVSNAQCCAAARAAVARDPADEGAALELRKAVTELAGREQSPRREGLPADPIRQAADLVARGSLEQGEVLVRNYLASVPNDPDAMLLMADIASRCGFPQNSEKILRRSVELHPDRALNLLALAKFLHRKAREEDNVELVDDALQLLDRLLATDPKHEDALRYKGALLVQVRRLEEGKAAFERLVALYPANAHGWVDLGHILKTLGSFGEGVAAFRTGLALDPANGAAWSMLADMKLARLFPADIEAMELALRDTPAGRHRIGIHFALAAAFHQARKFELAAEHLRQGNAQRLELHPHDMDRFEQGISTAIRTYTPEFFSRRSGAGNPSTDPIFIVGMPRAGSTLVEQILASHPAIEGTAELFAVQQIEGELIREAESGTMDEVVGGVPLDRLSDLGQRYLDLTRFHRRTGEPRFTDKNPGNWRSIGLIHAMLPNARIIDIRREPMDCCFANYSQHFAAGVNYSYGLTEMGSQYRQYVRLMRHFDAALPGQVHRIVYEDLVEDTETEVRKLLAYLSLPFDAACLKFFESQRAVHTPSSEQVRQPINRSGIGKWRSYEPWLAELESALGETVENWR